MAFGVPLHGDRQFCAHKTPLRGTLREVKTRLNRQD